MVEKMEFESFILSETDSVYLNLSPQPALKKKKELFPNIGFATLSTR